MHFTKEIKTFTFCSKKCEKLGCLKDCNKQDYYYYIYEWVIISKEKDETKQKEMEEKKMCWKKRTRTIKNIKVN